VNVRFGLLEFEHQNLNVGFEGARLQPRHQAGTLETGL
jgi:hypothetical protein